MESQASEEKETSSACPKCKKISGGWILEGSWRNHHHHSPPSKGVELPTYLNTPLFYVVLFFSFFCASNTELVTVIVQAVKISITLEIALLLHMR